VRASIAILSFIAAIASVFGLAARAVDEPGSSRSPRLIGISGTITYDGPLPDPIAVSEAATVRPLVEVDAKTKGLKEAVVWLEHEAMKPGDESSGRPAVMDQVNFFFVPHVLAVRAGQAVEFHNSDLANHGVIAASSAAKNRFNVMVAHGERYTHRFVSSSHPVAIGCPVHAAMAAWIFVFDHPYFAVTDSRGEFRLPAIAPGRYRLHVRHPDGGMVRQTEIVITDKTIGVRIDFHKEDLKRADGARR
jgi:plastocyanin